MGLECAHIEAEEIEEVLALVNRGLEEDSDFEDEEDDAFLEGEVVPKL